MQIRNVTENYCNLSFKHWFRTVEKEDDCGYKELQHKNDTFTYRDSNWWRRFGYFIDEFFKDSTKVNVYNWGCSDGEESATFIMHMFSNFPDTAEKFTPVYAKDYDPVAIEKAKEYVLPLDINEIYYVNCFTNNKLDEFLTKIPDSYKQVVKKSRQEFLDYVYMHSGKEPAITETVDAKFSEKYAKYIDYEVSDITEDYTKINPIGSLVIMRNFLPYLERDNIHELLENLSKQMREKCVLAVGKLEIEELFPLLRRFKSLGFESSNVWGVFYKP